MKGTSYRNIIIFFSLAFLMFACTSQEAKEQPGSSAMVFSVEPNSRANNLLGDNITDYPFVVFSDMTSMDRTENSEYITVHNATKVSYSTSANQWTYNDTQYWFPGYQYSFVAYYPADNRQLSGASYTKNNLQFTYKLPSSYKSATDLLIATHRRDFAGGDAEPVRFRFSHVLTNVNVLVEYKGFSTGPKDITVNSLLFKNIPTSSIYSIKPAPLSGDSKMTTDWTYPEESLQGWTDFNRGDYGITFNGSAARIIKANSGAALLFSKQDALLLIPNPDDEEERAEIELTYTTDEGEKKTVSSVIPCGWNPGTSLTLSMVLDNGLVQFSVSVDDWKEGSTTNTTVPRK